MRQKPQKPRRHHPPRRRPLQNPKGDNDRAIDDLSEAIRLDPKYVAAFITRGASYFAKRDKDRQALAERNRILVHVTSDYRLYG